MPIAVVAPRGGRPATLTASAEALALVQAAQALLRQLSPTAAAGAFVVTIRAQDGALLRLPCPASQEANVDPAAHLRLAAGDEVQVTEPRHSPDFRSVRWTDGAAYGFTAGQASVTRLLWEAWEQGTPDIGQETLLEASGSEGNRLADLFRSHPAWGRLIVPGATRGSFRLAEPPG
jgi:hypothetical protein